MNPLVPGTRYLPSEVLPHRGAMLLLDRIDDYGPDWVRGSLTVPASGPVHGARPGVPAWLGLEYMAQVVGAYSGIGQLQSGQAVSVGLLVGMRRYDTTVRHFEAGWPLDVLGQLTLSDENTLVVFDCTIEHEGRTLARAEIKAYRPEDIHRFLENEP